MNKIATHIEGLYYAKGSIFDIDDGNFDAIIVFSRLLKSPIQRLGVAFVRSYGTNVN